MTTSAVFSGVSNRARRSRPSGEQGCSGLKKRSASACANIAVNPANPISEDVEDIPGDAVKNAAR